MAENWVKNGKGAWLGGRGLPKSGRGFKFGLKLSQFGQKWGKLQKFEGAWPNFGVTPPRIGSSWGRGFILPYMGVALMWAWPFLKGASPRFNFLLFFAFFGRFLAIFGRFFPKFFGRGSLGWAWLAGHAHLG